MTRAVTRNVYVCVSIFQLRSGHRVVHIVNMSTAPTASKKWRRKLADEFSAHLCICTCVEIFVNYPKDSTSQIYELVMEVLHKRLKDKELHPRLEMWSDQFIIDNFSAFKSKTEWDAYDVRCAGTGQTLKKTCPKDAGIGAEYATWAKAIWLKFGRFKTHICNVVNVDYKNLLSAAGRIKSGKQNADVIEELRRKYFEEWVLTNERGVIMYAHKPIEECTDWVPGAWWHSWIKMGPPQGKNGCAPFMACGDQPTFDATEDDATAMPGALSELMNTQNLGRKQLREMSQQKSKKDQDTSHADDSILSSSKKSQSHIKLFDAHQRERDACIARLDHLISFPGLNPKKKQEYIDEKFEILMRPIVTLESCSVHRMTPSSATDTDDGAQRKSIARGFLMDPKKILDQDIDDVQSFSTAAPAKVDGSAASSFATINSDAGFEKTSEFHLKTLPHKSSELKGLGTHTLCYQPKQVDIDGESSTVFCRQRKLHLDAGYDPNHEEPNTSMTQEDAKYQQQGFVTSFFEKFDCPVPPYEAENIYVSRKDSMFDAFVHVVNSRNMRENGMDAEFLDISEMRSALSSHFRSHNGTIPGSGIDFQDDFSLIRHNFDGSFSAYCDELVLGRGGDPFVLHTFCHLFQFEAILFSVTEPGGTLFYNSELEDADVFSIVHVIDFVDDEDTCYSLVVPKKGKGSDPLSFLAICDKDALAKAKDVLQNCAKTVKEAKQQIEKDESNARFRSVQANRASRTENQRLLQLAEVAYERALKTCNDLKIAHEKQPSSVLISSSSCEKDDGSVPVSTAKVANEIADIDVAVGHSNSSMSTKQKSESLNDHEEYEEYKELFHILLPAVDLNHKSKKKLSEKPLPFEVYKQLFDKLPVWNVDLEVCKISDEIGRGIRAKKKFVKGSVLGIYDGNRCDEKGNIILAVPTLKQFFCQYPTLDRSISPSPFRKSHALCVGGTHVSGLFIDGFPLCHPCLDPCYDRLGKFSLANSASSHSAANMKPVWILSPHLPPDKINRCDY